MTIQEFINQWNGAGVDTDGYYGNQCKDLANQWADEIGHPLPAGNAIDMAAISIPGYTWVPNSPTAVPEPGDIVVWGTLVGANGHIDIFVSGDASNFTGFDQNWPIPKTGDGTGVAHLQPHNYNGVLGWQHPNQQVTQGDIVAVTQDDIKAVFTQYALGTPTAKQLTYYQANERGVLLTDVLNTVYASLQQAQAALQASESASKAPVAPQTTPSPSSSDAGLLQAFVQLIKKLWN